jgi:two-component system sensor histidine kinase VanS
MSHRRRLTIRTRLTLTYSALSAGSAIVMLVLVYVFLRYVPAYQLTPRAVSVTSTPLQESNAKRGSVAVASASAAEFLNSFLIASAIVLVIVIAGSVIVSWVVAGRVLRPLQEVTLAARLAGTGSFDHRVALEGPRDEVRELADTFDDMLGRLDTAFTAHKRFAANASHELRTPLATTKTILDVTLKGHDPDRAELLEVARRIERTNRRNIETVDALLDLAEIEQAEIVANDVALDRIAADAVEMADAEREGRGIAFHTALQPAPARGDPVLLRQAITNLVTNAVRHNVAGGEVSVVSGRGPDGPFVRVRNTGAEVPAETVASLTEPFVRGGGRVQFGGRGLGLAIVESITRAHSGTLSIEANDGGGLTVTLLLPATV